MTFLQTAAFVVLVFAVLPIGLEALPKMLEAGENVTLPCGSKAQTERWQWKFSRYGSPETDEDIVVTGYKEEFFVTPPWKPHAEVSIDWSASAFDLKLRMLTSPLHTGSFTCSLQVGGSLERNNTVYQLLVLAPPTLELPPTHLKAGQSLTLNCSTRSGSVLPNISWTRDGTVVTNSSATPITFVGGVGFGGLSYSILSITSLTAFDDGVVFSCLAKHTASPGEANWETKTLVGVLPALKVHYERIPYGHLNVTVSNLTATSVTVSWTGGGDGELPNWYCLTLTDHSGTNTSSETNGTVVSYRLTPDKNYTVTVQAVNKLGASDESSILRFQTPKAEAVVGGARLIIIVPVVVSLALVVVVVVVVVLMRRYWMKGYRGKDGKEKPIRPRAEKAHPPGDSSVLQPVELFTDTIYPGRREYKYTDDLSTMRSTDILVI